MLEPIMNVLERQRIILASSSPRRQEILKNMGLKFIGIPSFYEENLNPNDFKGPDEFVIATAVNKVNTVHEKLKSNGESYDLIIGADTIICKNSKIYGKPKDEEEAFNILKSFSGNTHHVYSGVCIKSKDKTVTFSENTKVFFGEVPDEVLRAYVKTGDYIDKAGGYGIQSQGGSLIERIEGDYFNVLGLPLHLLCKHILRLYSIE